MALTNSLGKFFAMEGNTPPVDLYWFFEISIRTEKKNQLELKKNQLVYN